MTNGLLRVICEETYGAPEDDPEGGCHCGIDCNRDAHEACPVQVDVDLLTDDQVARVVSDYGLDGMDRLFCPDRDAVVSAIIDGDIGWDEITRMIPPDQRWPGCEDI